MSIRCDSCLREYDSGYKDCPHCSFIKGGEAAELFFLKPGTILNGRYAVGQVLGFGGFGIIYKAWDNNDNQIVAIKEYYPSGIVARIPGQKEVKLLSDDRGYEFGRGKERFLEEAANTARFNNHPNIVSIICSFQENNTVYYVMEYLEGKSLSEYLKDNAKIGVEAGVGLILSICDAMKAVHAAGILHRDITPDNIIVPLDFPNGNVKLIDFGAARFSPEEKDTPGAQIMKPGYSPPEQYIAGSVQNEQIDVYALGATLFHILTGEEPEESTNRKVVDNVPDPRGLNDEIPEYISNAILKAMAVDPHLRFRTVSEFISALTMKKKVLPPKEEMKKRKAKRRSSVILLAAVIFAGLSMIAFWIYRENDSTTLPDASISMWYVITGDTEADEKKATELSAIVDDFIGVYPNVIVSLKGIEKSQYEGEVSAVLRRESSPIVLESDILQNDILSKTLDVSGIAQQESKNSYFLDSYTRYFPDKRQLPIGFNVTAVYVNPALSKYDKDGVGNLSELLATLPVDISAKGVALNELYRDDYETVLSGSYNLASRDSYFNKEAGVYFSNTSEFYGIRELMPAQYKLLYIDTKAVPADFSGLWSILPCDGAERKAAERLLRYLLSENAQDYLYVQNQNRALPLNKVILESYKTVYSEFDTFFTNIDRYSFNLS